MKSIRPLFALALIMGILAITGSGCSGNKQDPAEEAANKTKADQMRAASSGKK